MEFRRVLCRSYTGSYPACNEASECLAGLQHRLIPRSQIDPRRVEEIIPHRVRWNDHTALSLAQHGHLFDPFRKRAILAKKIGRASYREECVSTCRSRWSRYQ